MIIKANKNSYFVFDLDDTLYHEIDYLKSGFRSIAGILQPDSSINLFRDMLNIFKTGGNTFNYLIEKFPEKSLNLNYLLATYRNHYPDIKLSPGVTDMLSAIKSRGSKIGIITNGRVTSQNNKIEALGLKRYLDSIIISEEFGCEKPDVSLYNFLQRNNTMDQFYYFGDNVKIDFISPKKLGWCCIGIVGEKNIHNPDFNLFSSEYMPHLFIEKFTEIEII